VYIGDTPPSAPYVGQLWWDSVGALLYCWFNDGNSSQWVNVNNANNNWLSNPTDVGRNKLHNPMFTINQRGAGPWAAAGAPNYTSDRWLGYSLSDTASFSIVTAADADRAQVGDEAIFQNIQNSFTGANVAGAYNVIMQRIEGVRRLSGKTFTISFWAKAASGTPKLAVTYSQFFGTGGSPSPTILALAGVATLSTVWTRYSFTFTLPSIAGKTFGSTADTDYTTVSFWYSDHDNQSGGGIGVQSGTIQIWGVQMEVGSRATQLEKPDVKALLATCQRFYQANMNYPIWCGNTTSGSIYYYTVNFLVAMRAVPTVTTNDINNSGFPAGPPTIGSPAMSGFNAYKTSNGTGSASFFQFGWTASADL
jgi:hypothetical protein